MQKNGWVIVATDTDAGKTFVTAGLLRQFLRNGSDCLAVKPVQTGCEIDAQGNTIAPDVSVYLAASKGLLSAEHKADMLCYAYRTPCSPALAGELAGHEPELDVINSHVRSLNHTLLLVESAGGIFTPLNKHTTMLDLVKRLGFPVLIVADNRLGAINQVLLTVSALRQHNADIQGVILTHCGPKPEQDIIRDDNVRSIAGLGNIAILADIPHLPGFQPELAENWPLADPYFKPLANKLYLPQTSAS